MRTARFLAAIVAPILIVACAVGTAPTDTGEGAGGGGDGGATGDLDGSYGTIVDGAFIPPDAAPHDGLEAGTKDSGTVTPIDSGSVTPPPTSDECPSGNTAEYDFEWYASTTPCTVGDNDCDPGDCCFDRSLGSGDPYCITP